MFDEQQLFQNGVSGESFLASAESRRGSSFKNRLKALKRHAASEKFSVYFLTLTLSTSHMDIESKALHKFLMWLQGRFKARGQHLYYAWVLEYQLKRYAQYGDLVRHWHIAIAAPLGWLPNVEYLPRAIRHYHVISEGFVFHAVELFKRWGYGQCLCCVARGNLQQYLAKYLTKNLDGGASGSRMFSSSMMRWWSFPAWAFGVVQECAQSGLDIIKARLAKGEVGRILRLSVSDGVECNRLVVCSPWLRVAM